RTAADCTARVCLATSNNGGAGVADTITYTNRTNVAETVLVIVDSSTVGGGTFDIAAVVTTIPVGDTCTLADIYVPDGGQELAVSTAGLTNDYTSTGSTNCSFLAGNDRAWAVTIPPGQRGVFRADPDAGFDVSINLIPAPPANCDGAARTCTRSINAFTATTATDRVETLTRFNSTAQPEQFFAIVDSSAAGTYNFQFTTGVPAQGDRCENPIALTSGMATPGNLTSFVNDYFGSGTGCNFNTGRADAVYSISVAGGQNLDITVTPNAGLDTTISVATDSAACESRTCVANTTGGGAGAADTLRVTNRGSQPQTYFIIVDHSTFAADGSFTITATTSAAATGEFCSVATTLPTLPVDGESMNGFVNDYGGGGNCAPGSFSGPDRVYTVSVPPGRTTFTLTPDAGWNPSLSLVAAPASTCELPVRACISGADRVTTTGPTGFETIAISNTGTTPQSALLIVDTSTTSPGLFSLSQVSGPLVPGEDCATAIALPTDGGLLGESTSGMDNDLNNATLSCAGSGGRDRVYRYTVPAGQRIDVTVLPDAGFNPTLDLMVGLNGCATRQCADRSNIGSTGAADTVAWSNAGTTAAEVFVSVDSTSLTGTTGAGNFDLVASVRPVVAGDTCLNAIPVVNGTQVTATTALSTRDVTVPADASPCQSLAGKDLVYVTTVPAGQTLTAAITAVTGDPTINFVAGPAANCVVGASCLASVDNGAGGGNETLTWLNTGSQPQQVFIVIGNYSATVTPDAAFSLAITIN
ncbi:MAG: hypothetical protein GQE15_16715, partial [Archangiaceae bacterium]|nr:hypothetical protein [Archangiaceae bacterium]